MYKTFYKNKIFVIFSFVIVHIVFTYLHHLNLHKTFKKRWEKTLFTLTYTKTKGHSIKLPIGDV